jgi:hypothetical protein
MIQGSCLCGGVRFEIARATGPFELCHCSRCRKVSGSAFIAGLGVRREDFRFVAGTELIRTFDAPILESPPAYRTAFCSRCGSPVPDPTSAAPWFEIAAGALDDDPGIRPQRHIMVDRASLWFEIADALPQLDRAALLALRTSQSEDGAHDLP